MACDVCDTPWGIVTIPPRDWRGLACELNIARRMVESEVAERSARMQLTTNSQMPSWSRYVAAQRAWDTAVSAFLDSVGTQPE